MIRLIISFIFCASLSMNINGQATIVTKLTFNDDNVPLPYRHTEKYDFEFYCMHNDKEKKIDHEFYKIRTYYPTSTWEDVIGVIFRFDHILFPPKSKKRKIEVYGRYRKKGQSRAVWTEMQTNTIYKSGSNANKFNDSTSRSQFNFNVSAPELLSVTVLNDYILEKLLKLSEEEGGFSNMVSALKYLIKKDSDDKNINYLEIIRYQKLLKFVEQYAEENSFYQQEAKTLANQITTLDSLLSLNSEQKNDSLIIVREESRNAYKGFQKVNNKLQELYSQLQPLLFSCDCTLSNLDEVNLIEPKKRVKKTKVKKPDFSVGFTFSLFDNAQDQDIFLESIDPGVFIREDSNTDFITPSFAVFLNQPLITKKSIAVGLNVGIGVNLKSANLGLFTGGSIFIGKERTMIINGGLSYLVVRQLDCDCLNDFFPNPTAVTPNNVTKKVLKPSPFISISYNFTRRN